MHGTWTAPWGSRRSRRCCVIQAGQNWGRTFSATPELRHRPHRGRAAEPNRQATSRFDFRVEKTVQLGRRLKVGPFIDIYNVFNANPEQNVTWASGSSFLRPTAIVPPRVLPNRREGELVADRRTGCPVAIVHVPLYCGSRVGQRRLCLALAGCQRMSDAGPPLRRPLPRPRCRASLGIRPEGDTEIRADMSQIVSPELQKVFGHIDSHIDEHVQPSEVDPATEHLELRRGHSGVGRDGEGLLRAARMPGIAGLRRRHDRVGLTG